MTTAQTPAGGAAFAALRHRAFRSLAVTSALAIMADNVEHVISYWMIFEAFHSPALAGFAVISHWAPFLFFGLYIGALADRFDCRKMIVASMVAFMTVSVSWAALFLTGQLQPWHAVILLITHGFAGALLSPARQLIMYDVVGPDHLQSAIRLSATTIQMGFLFGPGVGGALLVLVGPAWGLLANSLVYLPMVVWALRVPYTGHGREAAAGTPRGAQLTLAGALKTLRVVAGNPELVVMIALAGVTSLLVGNAYQAQMPEFAIGFGAGQGQIAYSVLLGANAAGSVLGGILLEVSGLLRLARTTTAIVLALLWSASIVLFAIAPTLPIAVVALFAGGVLNIGFTSMAQTLVQLGAPADRRGQVIGLYGMSALGLRVGSGVTVGVLGTFIGIHLALELSALLMLAICAAMLVYALSKRREGRLSA